MIRRAAAAKAAPLVCCCVALILAQAPPAQAQLKTSADGEFIYRAQARDTLIGLGRRLLMQPQLWRALQSRNHIADPRRIPEGTALYIPYEWLRMNAETATVASVGGTVTTAGRGVAAGQVLAQGSVIETGPDGSVTIDLADGSVVTLQKSSVLGLGEMTRVSGVDAAHSIRLKLDSGRVDAEVKPHRDVGRFEIITPVAVSAVRGTQFRSGFLADGERATTETLAGAVGVSTGSDRVAVPQGFGTRIDRDRPPLPPVALLPPPDLSQIAPVATGATFDVAWAPVAGAQGYRVQLSPSADFHVLIADQEAPDPAARLGVLEDGVFWLRARSIDPLGLEGADAVIQFTRHALPSPPSPSAPEEGAKLDGTRAQFAWRDAGPGLRYTLELAHDAKFSALAARRDELATTAADVTDLPPGRYFWRVAAVNPRGEAGPWSEARSYTQRPEAPLPDAPLVVQKEVHFTWPALPGQTYRALVARDEAFRHLVYDGRTDTPALSIRKPFPGVYHVRVQAIAADGEPGSFGPAREFTIPYPFWSLLAPAALLLSLAL